MPTDHALIPELVQAISNVIHDLGTGGGSVFSLSNTSREELVRNAERLAIAAREPEENLYFQATQVSLHANGKGKNITFQRLTNPISQTAQNSAIRTAIDMGIFDKMPDSGESISAIELSAALQVDERLLSKSRAPYQVEWQSDHR